MRTVLGLVSLLVAITAGIYLNYFRSPIYSDTKLEESYDFIIVGGGSAGAALAYRLSEDPNNRVLLLEAGGEDTKLEIHIPAGFYELQRSFLDWSYNSTIDPEDPYQRLHFWPRGKVLGGSSVLNLMLAVRGNKLDYDRWAQVYGAEGWDFKSVEPYFKKLESLSTHEKAPHRGRNGPVNIISNSMRTDLGRAFALDSQLAGLNYLADYNGDNQLGVSLFQFNIKKGIRQSTAVAYLRIAALRSNLHIRTRAHVTRLIFNEDKSLVTAVAFKAGPQSEEHVIKARKEVILSAGAINSPQLLMLSGIGPCSELKALGIECIHDLPVGKNLHDHIFLPEIFKTEEKHGMGADDENISNFVEYLLSGTGYGDLSAPVHVINVMCRPLGVSPAEVTTFIDTKTPLRGNSFSNRSPDLQFHFTVGVPFGKMLTTANFAMDDLPYWGCVCYVTLLHSKSRGSIRLKSSDPFEHPEIKTNYLSHPEDVEVMRKGTLMAREIVNNGVYLKALGVTPHIFKDIKAPYNSTEYILEHLQRHTLTVYHPAGTCKMGKATDPTTVVDPQLRVKGVKNLRVADASIMPEAVSGNTNLPSIMIGERAADLIAAAWKK